MKDRSFNLHFTSRQVVVVICVIALAAILLPVGVEAATGSSVNITDPTKSTYKAKVSGVGALLTGLCQWNNISTPTCANVTNHALNVTGAVDATGSFVFANDSFIPLVPIWCNNVISTSTIAAANMVAGGGTGCSGQTLTNSDLVAVTSLTVTNNGTVDPVRVTLSSQDSTNCSGTVLDNGPAVLVAAGHTEHLTFPQPYVAPGGGTATPTGNWSLCANLTGPNGGGTGAGAQVLVDLVGYLD